MTRAKTASKKVTPSPPAKKRTSAKTKINPRVLHDTTTFGTTRLQTEITEERIVKLAKWLSHEQPTAWEVHYEIIIIARDIFQEEIHNMALPFAKNVIMRWEPHRTHWETELPGFRVDKAGLQAEMCHRFKAAYTKATNKYIKKHGNRGLAQWRQLQEAWSRIGKFFYHHWCLHPEMSKIQAHAHALALGEKNVKVETDLTSVIEGLFRAKRVEYCSVQVHYLLMDLDEHTPQKEDHDAFLGVYFMYKDEEKAQERLRRFLAAKQFKCGHFKDFIKASKTWLKTANDKDKEEYKLFEKIYSMYEVVSIVKMRKKELKSTRTRDATRLSHTPVEETRKARLHEIFQEERLLALLNRSMAHLRRHSTKKALEPLFSKLRKNPKKPNFSALNALGVHCVSSDDQTCGPKYQWLVPTASDDYQLLQMLLPVVSLDPQLLRLEGVDNSIDIGKNLTKAINKVFATLKILKSSDTRRKGTQLLTLLKQVLETVTKWRAHETFLKDREQATCHICSILTDSPSFKCGICRNAIHPHCGISWDGLSKTLDCITCCKVRHTTPPMLDPTMSEGAPSFHPPGHQILSDLAV